jgi:hypothetical protein
LWFPEPFSLFFVQRNRSKAGREASSTDTRQLISGIPRIRGRHARISAGGQIAIQIVRLSRGAKHQLLIVRIIFRGREGRRDIRLNI